MLFSEEVIVVDSLLHSLGYRTKGTNVVPQTEWQKKTFGAAKIVTQKIKSVKATAGGSRTFYRFTLTKETYASQTAASKRIKNLRKLLPPDVNTKMNPDLILCDGFVHNNSAYILSTDVNLFSYDELPRVLSLLREHLQK